MVGSPPSNNWCAGSIPQRVKFFLFLYSLIFLPLSVNLFFYFFLRLPNVFSTLEIFISCDFSRLRGSRFVNYLKTDVFVTLFKSLEAQAEDVLRSAVLFQEQCRKLIPQFDRIWRIRWFDVSGCRKGMKRFWTATLCYYFIILMIIIYFTILVS